MEQGAAFLYWTVEEKAEFSSELPALIASEQAWTAREHPDWGYSAPMFTWLILDHAHGVPDEQAIPQEEALEKAKAWLREKMGADAALLDTARVSACYYVDEPAKPQWVFRFYDRTVMKHEVWLDAQAGSFPRMSGDEVQALADQYLAQKLGVRAETLSREPVSRYLSGDSWRVIYRGPGNTAVHTVEIFDPRGWGWIDGEFTSAPEPTVPAASSD
ncbi:MAG: hypothetical protein IJZ74_10725 [Clostridia bacterium]|nr:hypothetical protein [Clostridia bacterium]